MTIDQNHDFGIDDVIRGVLSRKLLVLIAFGVTVTAVGIATLICPRSFTSDAKLFVRLGRENVVIDPTATLGENAGIASTPLSRVAEMNSIAEMMKSKQLIARVVNQVGHERILKRKKKNGGDSPAGPSLPSRIIDGLMGQLTAIGVFNDLPRHERAVIKLKKKLDIEAIDETNVITISFESHSPEIAQEVVQLVLDYYLTEHSRLNRTEGAFTFLSDQTEAVRRELEEAENGLRLLKNKTGILSVDQDRGVLLQRLARLRDDWLNVKSQEIALDAEVQNLSQRLAKIPDSKIVESRTGAGNEGADGMRQQLFDLEMRKEALASTHRKEHPQVKKIQVQLDAVSKLLKKEEAGRRETVIGPNVVYDKTLGELILKRSQLVALKSRGAALSEQIADVESQMLEFTKNEVDYAQLNRLIAVKDASYRKSAQNLLQAKIDDNLKRQQISNIAVAQAATRNLRPSFPNKLVNLILGLFFGVLNAVGLATLLEYRNPNLPARETAERYLDIPFVAEFAADAHSASVQGA